MPTDQKNAGDNKMNDNQVVLEALKDGLDRVHSRIDEIGRDQTQSNSTHAVFAERLTNHIGRNEIHQVPVDSCPKSTANESVLREHITKHPHIVKKDIGGIVGAAIIGAMLLAGAGYIATKVFGG